MQQFLSTKFGQFLKNNYKLLLLITGLSILNLFFLCWSFASNQLTFGKTFIFLAIGSIILEIILCTIIFVAKHQNWKIEKIFLILGLIVGVFYVFALPVGRAPDEESHFFRIYELTQGQLVSDTAEDGHNQGSIQSSNIEIVRDFKENNVAYYDIINHLGDYPDESDQTFIITSASGYNPVNYAPQLLGMGLGQALHLPFLINAYLAKLFNCIVCIAILYFCIKYIPFLKKFIFFVAFLPLTMQAMTSLSADGFITVTAIALTTFVLHSVYAMKTKFTKRHYALMLTLCLILSLSKVVYALLCFLLFAIPKERFRSSKTKLITIFSIGGICAVVLASWLFLSSSLGGAAADPTNREILMHNPFMYLAILVKSLSTNFNIYLPGTLGGFLEWYNVVLSPLYICTSFVIFIFLCKYARDHFPVTRNLRILSIVIFIIIALAAFTTMYISWTKPGETTIDGVQGRYFLPLLLLIPLALTPSTKAKRFTAHLQQNYYLYSFLALESVYAITMIASTHL